MNEVLIVERRNRLELLGNFEVWPGCAVGIDDSFGEQIRNRLAPGWNVGREEVIECPIFTNQHDDMFDGSCSVIVVAPSTSACTLSEGIEIVGQKREQGRAHRHSPPHILDRK